MLSMVCGSAGASPSQAIFNKAKALVANRMMADRVPVFW